LRLFSFGGYGLALATLALVVFGAYDGYPKFTTSPRYLFYLYAEMRKDVSLLLQAFDFWSRKEKVQVL